MRIAVITSRNAKSLIESIVKERADVIALPIHAIAFLTTEVIAKIIDRNPALKASLRRYDVILVPGTVKGDTRPVSEVTGNTVVKASRSPSLLPQILDFLLKGGSLDTAKPAEELLSTRLPEHEFKEAFTLGGIRIPLRGPPIILASEIPPDTPINLVKSTALRLSSSGASLIIVGCSFDDSPETLGRKVSIALAAGTPVIAEAPSPDHAEEAVKAGATAISIGAERISDYLDVIASNDSGVIVGERSLDSLKTALGLLERRGVTKILVDPVLGVPLVDFSESIVRYREASRLGYPLVFSSANVIEEIDADTHSLHALLAVIALELGASVYTTVEASYKSRYTTLEAKEALRLVSEAWRLKTTPRGIPSRLLVIRQPEPPQEPLSGIGGEEVGYVEPAWDRRGYIIVFVDHDRGLVGATYKLYSGGEITVKGSHPQSVARALVRRAGLDPEHAAYLGFELSKAYISLKLGKSYIQDYDIIIPPWVSNND